MSYQLTRMYILSGRQIRVINPQLAPSSPGAVISHNKQISISKSWISYKPIAVKYIQVTLSSEILGGVMWVVPTLHGQHKLGHAQANSVPASQRSKPKPCRIVPICLSPIGGSARALAPISLGHAMPDRGNFFL